MNITSIKRAALKTYKFCKRYLPHAFAALAGAGTVIAVVEAIKAKAYEDGTLNEVDRAEEQKKVDKFDDLIGYSINNDSKFKRVLHKTYIYRKPILSGISTLGCLGVSTFIFADRQKRLTIANDQMNSILQKYVSAAKAATGLEGTKLLNKLAPTQVPDDSPPFDYYPDDDGLTLFWDPIFNDYYHDNNFGEGYWFRASEKDFLEVTKDIMRNYMGNCLGQFTVNDFYEELGVDPPIDEHGHPYYGYGWRFDETSTNDWGELAGILNIHYSEIMTLDGMEYRKVLYEIPPRYCDDLL